MELRAQILSLFFHTPLPSNQKISFPYPLYIAAVFNYHLQLLSVRYANYFFSSRSFQITSC